MEEPLLFPSHGHKKTEQPHSTTTIHCDIRFCVRPCGVITWRLFYEEVKRLGYIAGPMVAATVSQYMIQIISIMMLGHLGQLALSSTALAGVTGFSFIIGMASALETLCGQAYGAQHYRKVGIQTQTAIFCLLLVCLPISLIWIYIEKILLLIGQDPQISREAGKFVISLVPALFAYAVLQPLLRYFQTQSLITPMLLSSFACILIHTPLCWVLVFKSDLKNLGAALAIDISYWLNVIFLGVYLKFSPACDKTRSPVSMELFQGIGEFFRFAIPSAVMVCLEWWSFELLIVLSGLLPNPQLETSVLSVCTRVANELGAGNATAACNAVYAAMSLAVTSAAIICTTLFASRSVFGYAFSNEEQVVNYVSHMAPLVCFSVVLDGVQGVLSGVARGCGWQNVGALINLAAFYLCGIPVSAILGFWVDLKGIGLWIGIQAGAFTQSVLLSTITSRIDWEQQARKARERIFEGVSPIVV